MICVRYMMLCDLCTMTQISWVGFSEHLTLVSVRMHGFVMCSIMQNYDLAADSGFVKMRKDEKSFLFCKIPFISQVHFSPVPTLSPPSSWKFCFLWLNCFNANRSIFLNIPLKYCILEK